MFLSRVFYLLSLSAFKKKMFLSIIMEGLASDVGITMVMEVVKLTLAVTGIFSVKLMIATITKFDAC